MTHLNHPKIRECTAADLIPTKDGKGIFCCNCGASERRFHNEQFDNETYGHGLDLITRIISPGFTETSFENIIMKGGLL